MHLSDFSNCALTDKFEHISLFSCYIWSIVDIDGVQCQDWLRLRLKIILIGENFYTISKKNYNLRAVLISYTGLAIRIFGAIRMKNIKITTVLCIDFTISNIFHTENVENLTKLKCKNGKKIIIFFRNLEFKKTSIVVFCHLVAELTHISS